MDWEGASENDGSTWTEVRDWHLSPPFRRGFGLSYQTAPRGRGAGNQVPNLPARRCRPTKLRPDQLPFCSPQCLVSGLARKVRGISPHLVDDPIHLRRDAIVAMSSDKLGQGPGVKLAAGRLQAARKTFSFLKDVIRDGNSGLHTKSITARACKSIQRTDRYALQSRLGPLRVPREPGCRVRLLQPRDLAQRPGDKLPRRATASKVHPHQGRHVFELQLRVSSLQNL